MSKPDRKTSPTISTALATVQVHPLPTAKARAHARRLLAKHHYLGDVRAVGEQLFYALTDGHEDWLGVLVFCAASRRLRARDRWIGWSEEQRRRRRRLPLVVNNCRFLLLPPFWRLLAHIDGDALETVFLQVQTQLRGPAPPEELIVLDGKEPRHGGGHSVLTSITVPSQHYLGSAIVDQKTNEIPVARQLFHKLDLDGRKVSLDALHTQDQTVRELVLEHGADFLMTAKANQPTLLATIKKLVPSPPAGFSPSAGHGHAGGQSRDQQRPA